MAKYDALEKYGRLLIVQECVWRKSGLAPTRSPFSPFYYEENITEKKILHAVSTGEFFGFLNVTMSAPESVLEKYAKINFLPVFKKYKPEKNRLSERMLFKPFCLIFRRFLKVEEKMEVL